MSSERTNIPRSIKRFNQYLIQTCAYLLLGTPTNADRFKWTPANITAWMDFQTHWTPLFLLYSDKKGGYTTNIKNALLGIIANAVIYAKDNKLIELVKATVSLNSVDCSTFNLPAKLAIPSVSTHSAAKSKELDKTIVTPEPVYPKLIPLSGGFLKIEGFTEATQSGRAHKLQSFDMMQYAIAVFYGGTANLPTLPTDARLTTDYSSKASFILATAALTNNLPVLATGVVAPPKVAVLFFRWAKSKHPALNGPWSGPFTTTLL